jgi:hypothetical protein
LASASIYSLIGTAKACGLTPPEYLLHVFERLPHVVGEDDLKALDIKPPRPHPAHDRQRLEYS